MTVTKSFFWVWLFIMRHYSNTITLINLKMSLLRLLMNLMRYTDWIFIGTGLKRCSLILRMYIALIHKFLTVYMKLLLGRLMYMSITELK